jgi:hypothetical protein
LQASDLEFDGAKQKFEPLVQVAMPENIQSDTPLQMATTRSSFQQFSQHKRRNISILISLGLIICLIGGGTWLWPIVTSHVHQGTASSVQTGGDTLAYKTTPSPTIQVTPISTLQPTPTNLPASTQKASTAQVAMVQSTSTTQPTLVAQPTPAPTTQPAPAHQTVVDNLNDWSLVYSHTTNLSFDPNNSQHFNGDTSLIVRTTLTREAIVWHLQDMQSFRAVVYFWPGEAVSPFSVYTSSDDQDWAVKTPAISGQPGNWERYVYTLSNLSNTNFVMLQWNSLHGQVWNPQVSSVTFSN